MGGSSSKACHCDDDGENSTAVEPWTATESVWTEEVASPQPAIQQSAPAKQQAESKSAAAQTASQLPAAPPPATSAAAGGSAGGAGPPALPPIALSFDVPANTNLGVIFVLAEESSYPAGVLVASVVESGAFLSKNSASAPGVFAGDVVKDVNGGGGTAAELDELLRELASNGGRLKLVVQPRSAAFDVVLGGPGSKVQKFGLVMAIDKNQTEKILIRTVRDIGLMPEWNAAHCFTQVVPGDCIIQVDGEAKKAAEMYEDMQRVGKDAASLERAGLQLRIQTPPRT